jgi:hypothetical protein
MTTPTTAELLEAKKWKKSVRKAIDAGYWGK